MIVLLSPAKTLDFNHKELGSTLPVFFEESIVLNGVLKKKSTKALRELMNISEKLAKENVERNQSFSEVYADEQSRAAIYTFKGDVYRGLEVEKFNKNDLKFANKHVRILSGLYGLLKPMDKMQAYRLEMGTNLKVKRKKNLYEFWGEKLSGHIIEELNECKDKLIINLASNEYFKAVNHKSIQDFVINVNFKEYRDEKLKFVSFNAKKARGLMTQFIVKNRIKNPEDLKGFNLDNYGFSDEHSDDKNFLFVR